MVNIMGGRGAAAKNNDSGKESKFDPSKVEPAKMEKISLNTVKYTDYLPEKVETIVNALTRNGLALHPSLTGKKGEYTITHINSGLRFHTLYTNKNKAEKAFNEISAMHDWGNKNYLKGSRASSDLDATKKAIATMNKIVGSK
jgi:hypothetical protein